MVLGVFTDRINAEVSISELEKHGFDPKDISIIMKDESGKVVQGTGFNIAEGAASGAATGGILGGLTGLLIGIGAITMPGVGAILIGGPIAAALGITGAAATAVSGAVTGALAGGFVGALVGLGVPEEVARDYEEAIKQGAILIAVPTIDRNEDEAREIMGKHQAHQIRAIGLSEEKDRDSEDRGYHHI